MKTKQIFLKSLLITFAIASNLFGQSTDLNGTVADPSGAVIQGAVVTARRSGQTFTTTTNAEGRFAFSNLPRGEYSITVTGKGFSPYSSELTDVEQELKISLELSSVAETVVVQPEVNTYLADTSTIGTKLDIPQRDLPQSVSVVPNAILKDRLVIRLTEAGDNVSSVRSSTGYSGTKSNNYLIRGFAQSFTSSGTMRNGFTEYAFLTQRDPVNVDRIEFLKGPASLLYGASEVGGLVNTITKKPLEVHRYEAGVAFGGFGLFRPTFDATGPLRSDGSLLYRVNFAFDQGNSYRDLVKNRNIFFAPSLIWKIGDKTSLLAELEIGRFRNDFDRGFITEPEFLDEDFSKNYAEPWTSAINKNLNAMLNFTHAFNESLSFRSGLSHVRSQTDLNATSSGFPQIFADRRTLNRVAIRTDEYSENYNSQNELYASFSTGGIRHRLVAGAEYSRFQFKYIFDRFTLAPIDRINPVYGATPGAQLFGFNDDSLANQYGLYVQDHIELTSYLKVLVGGRAGFVDSETRNFPSGTLKNEQSIRSFTPRAGIVYQPLQATSVYFSYTTSFAANFQSRSRLGEQFDPTTGRLFEGGIKQSLFNNRVLATLAVYELRRRNVLVPDPVDPFTFSIQTGVQRSRGLEIEVNGQVSPGFNLNATYAAIEAIVASDTRPELIGNRLVGAPRSSGGFFGTYVLDMRRLRGLTLGGGVSFATETYANLPNRNWRLPSYARVDLNLGYRRENWRFDLAVKNLNNARYFETGGFNSMMPQATRHAIGSVSYSF